MSGSTLSMFSIQQSGGNVKRPCKCYKSYNFYSFTALSGRFNGPGGGVHFVEIVVFVSFAGDVRPGDHVSQADGGDGRDKTQKVWYTVVWAAACRPDREGCAAFGRPDKEGSAPFGIRERFVWIPPGLDGMSPPHVRFAAQRGVYA